MKNQTVEYCKENGKYKYSSEAKAIRAVNRYDQIKRAYFCKYCEGFHTTSETLKATLENGEVTCEEENELLRKYNNKIVDQIDELYKRYNKLKQVYS